jgi:NAD(P)H-nitrite reductase large subunit
VTDYRSHRYNPFTSVPPFRQLSTLKLPSLERGRSSEARAADRRAERALRAGYADLLIIGNGIAGLATAVEARQYAPDAEIVIVTEQNHPTINTPALKQFGAGLLELEQLLAYPPGTERQLGIGVINARAERLDTSARQVQLASGQTIKYGRLLLATGAQPTTLPHTCPGRTFDGVLTLHRLQDYLDLRRRLPAVSSAVVIGGGFHAAETAIMLHHWGIRITWLIRGSAILSKQVDEPTSEVLLQHLKRSGIDIRLETELAGIVGRIGTVAGIVTTDNDFLPCQLVLLCIGTAPAVSLAQGTSVALNTRNGLQVNQRLQTAVPDVYAAGDVASILDPQTGQHQPRAQWYSAFQQGRVAAAALTGAAFPTEARASVLGCFWHATQLGDMSILIAGAPLLTERDHRDNEVLTSGSPGFHRRIIVRDNRLLGYLAVGPRKPGGLAIKRLIDEQLDIRDIKRQLLTADFDVRTFLVNRRLSALQTGSVGRAAAPARQSRRLQFQPALS